MKAVILAGGKGTRMGHHTQLMPKPMLKVGNKPILEHQVELLKKYGIREIIILVNYFTDKIVEYFGQGEKWGVDISYYEEKEPLGTVGGIKAIEDRLEDDFIVFYGDVMINMQLQYLIDFHYSHKSDCTLVLHPNNHPYDSDLADISKTGKVTAIHSKPHKPGKYYRNLVNAGAYVFHPKILTYLEKNKKADFGRDIFPELYDKINMFGYRTSEYLKDMGTPSRWEEVENDYQSGKITRAGYEFPQKAIFLDRDGVINVEQSYIHLPEDMTLYPFTAEAVKKINLSEYLSVVVTNQSVIARNLCTIEELENIHNKMETDLGSENAYLDAIYYCPHHPDKGYPEENAEYKIDCNCRKPKTGMFEDAARDFHIDLKQSYMIGDSERDVQAGKNAGCTTIGVMTGYGMRKTSVRPDYFFKNLLEAVDFIMEEPYHDLFQQITEIFKPDVKKPFVISIAGNARNGKSTMAAYFSRQFQQQGLRTLTIELDNWILPEDQREHCKSVYDRFNLDKLEKDIESLFKGEKIQLSSYPNHPERDVESVEYFYKDEEVVIIEGVVALSSEKIRNLAHTKIFIKTDTALQKERIYDYYNWRGKEKADIEQLFEKRTQDEYSIIEKESKLADFIINPKNT